MRAIVYEKFGPPEVLFMKQVAKPVPRDGEILVKIFATTVTIGDTIMRSLNIPGSALLKIMSRLYLGITKPRRPILGMEISGEIEAVGKDVSRFKVGDQVLASTFQESFGGYAEYKCLSENGLVALKPANTSFEQAAALPSGGMTAYHCLEQGNISSGQKVLIFGASGSVGTFAVQIARNHYGAEVTGVCSTANMDLVRSLGASQVIDYTREEFSQRGDVYDLVFDAVGRADPEQCKRVLKPEGRYLNVHKDFEKGDRIENLLAVRDLVEAGKLNVIIDRQYTMEQIVEAHRYVDEGHKKGNVVITILSI